MLAYPTENNKGKFIAIFWSIFNMGGVVGASVSLGQNYDSHVSGSPDSWCFGVVTVLCLGEFGYVSWLLLAIFAIGLLIGSYIFSLRFRSMTQ